jgi:hypothetical protein
MGWLSHQVHSGTDYPFGTLRFLASTSIDTGFDDGADKGKDLLSFLCHQASVNWPCLLSKGERLPVCERTVRLPSSVYHPFCSPTFSYEYSVRS